MRAITKDYIKIGLIIVCIYSFLSLYKHIQFITPQNLQIKTIHINNKKLTVQVATTQEENRKGLMFTKTMPYDQGMLFITDKYQDFEITTKNMMFPIDIIFLSANKTVIDTISNADACRKMPCQGYTTDKAKPYYVIEVNAGWVEKNSIKVQDQFTWD